MSVHNKCTTLVGDVDNGGTGVGGNFLYLLLSFAKIGLKTLKLL